ncbi:UDP-glucose 4-epimerase [Flavobacterium psychrophilum]|nr:UDP-glucose 4-epimerase [Flavobacterium psychrophilum]AOE51724.1 UDP-glucose 4-epimerase [Flavobacterium psychrophilum]
MYKRIDVTPQAIALIAELKKRYGELMFHQSGGCCDGSQPMCFEKGDFKLGYSDVCLGVIEDCEFWMSKDQFEYWKHTHLTLNAIDGRGASFSLEIPLGKRFMIESRLFTEEEAKDLEPVSFIED